MGKTCGMIKNKILQPGTGRHYEKRTKLARNANSKIVGRWRRVETDPYKRETILKEEQKTNKEFTECTLKTIYCGSTYL